MPTPTPATLAARRANGAVHLVPDRARRGPPAVADGAGDARGVLDTSRHRPTGRPRRTTHRAGHRPGDRNRLRADLNRTRTGPGPARSGDDPARRPRADPPNAALDAAILEFMASTPVKLTAAVIAANIGMEVLAEPGGPAGARCCGSWCMSTGRARRRCTGSPRSRGRELGRAGPARDVGVAHRRERCRGDVLRRSLREQAANDLELVARRTRLRRSRRPGPPTRRAHRAGADPAGRHGTCRDRGLAVDEGATARLPPPRR